jgi:hypothetical protein
MNTNYKMIPFSGGIYLMKRSYLAHLLLLILIFTLCAPGCGALKSVYGDRFHISRSKPRNTSHSERAILRKKVLVAPLINTAGLKDEKAGVLTDALANLLKENNTLLIKTLTEFESPQSSAASAEIGVVTDPVLIKKAGDMGMNILITSVLEPLNYTADKGIIWPFNKFKGEYDVSMVVNAVDVTSGMLIFSFRESEKIEMGEVPEKDKNPVPLADETLNKVLSELQERLASSLLDVLAGQSWRGKITREGEKIRISGGTDIGITVGNVFEVFSKAEAIKSIGGRDYYVDGLKVGEIKATEVMEDHSFAVPIGEGIEDGQIIALKSK